MRREAAKNGVVTALAAILAAGAVGCGGGGSSGTSSQATAASTAPAAAPWTPAHAQAFASSVLLTAADVPGFTASPHHESAADRQNVAQLARCAGAVDPSRRVADVHSDDFKRGSGIQLQEVGSSVDVLPSASLSEQDFAKFAAASARTCVAEYAARALSHSSSSLVKFGTPSILTLTPPAGSSSNSFGYRFVIPVTAGQLKIRFYADLLFHRTGPAEVAFTDLGIGVPFPAGDQQRLFAMLVKRADAHGA